MKLIEKNRSDIILALLFIESVFLSFAMGNRGLFWFIFIVSAVTVFLYGLLVLNIPVKTFLQENKKNDVLLIVFMTAMFNANVVVFQNRIILAIVFAVYYVGLRFLVRMFKDGPINQIQKNALNLSVFITVFLGSNFIFTFLISLEKGTNNIILIPINIILFFFIYLISYYSFTKNRVATKWSRTYSLVLALVTSEVSMLTGFYLQKYPTFYKTENISNVAITTAPLFIIVTYYCIYGLMIHKLEKNFYPRVIFEYVGTATIIILTLLVTIKWSA